MKNLFLLIIFILIIVLGNSFETLEPVSNTFEFLYVNFNFPLLILIIIFIFKQELKDLINRISKITHGETSIHLDLEYLKEGLENKADFYKDVEIKQAPRIGGGGRFNIPNEDLIRMTKIQILYTQNMLNNYLENEGSVATIQKLYMAYEEVLKLHYNLTYTDINTMKNRIRHDGTEEELQLFDEIVAFYSGVTYFDSHENGTGKLLRDKDVMNYKKLISVAVSQFYFYSVFNHPPDNMQNN
ncbi:MULTISPECIES: hypothetical protein [Jeotgalicoccus]|uniref:Uncharacterized protein n=1 Tax=Jeotgalicoccus nanhaiensis TaxID=568603 RepID=A0ABR9XWV5_9STAP|nr:hypothetical protein [Jeotgalicoccus nanhaiensis]MBF0753479.1 hypothetical protein [Jeotgalicoccus nanhaiensis]TFU62635.1 hypothetical protein E4T89_04260 [Jeotgalicoccus nanhaiensis]